MTSLPLVTSLAGGPVRAALLQFAVGIAARLVQHPQRVDGADTRSAAERGPDAEIRQSYDSRISAVVDWNDDLKEVIPARCDRPPAVEVLTAFGSVFDRTCDLDPEAPQGLAALLDWVEQQCADPDAGWPAPSTDPTRAIYHPRDIPSALTVVLAGEGGKSGVEHTGLRQRLVGAGFPGDHAAVGGAAAIICDTLNRLGVCSTLYTHYHSEAMAELFCDEARWLDLNCAGPLTPRPARSTGCAGHPTRYGFALAYQAGDYAPFLGPFGEPGRNDALVASKADRHLLVLKQPMGARSWQSWHQGGQPQNPALAEDEWPMLTGFVRWETRDGVLLVEEAPAAWLSELGTRHAYVIVTLPQPKEIRNQAATDLLRKQFRLLREAGAVLHLEFSSGAGCDDDLSAYARFAEDCLDSVGVNAAELRSYAGLVDPRRWPRMAAGQAAPAPSERFEQALALATRLCVERLYVHGNDIDIILRRGASLEALEEERQGDLFAKGAVFVATTLRNHYTLGQVRRPTEFPTNALTKLAELRKHLSDRSGARRSEPGQPLVIAAATPDDYGVLAVPCIWYTEATTPRPFNSTGAGDITSGVSMVYSGFHASRRGSA